MEELNLKDLLKAGVHFGHRTSRWSPKMAPFIWGAKSKIHLIDISKTALLLKRAADYLKKISAEGKSILWVGTKKPAQAHAKRIAESLNMPSVTYRWVGGTLSNYDQIKKAITRYLHLQDVIKKSATHYTKKEVSTLQKEIARLEKNVGGIVNLSYPPAALVIVDAQHEKAAVKEALSLNIPIIAMVDTNTDPSGINFVIPANDDSSKSIEFIMNYLGEASKAGRAVYEEQEAQAKMASKAKAQERAAAKAAPKKAEPEHADAALEALAREVMADDQAEKERRAAKASHSRPAPARVEAPRPAPAVKKAAPAKEEEKVVAQEKPAAAPKAPAKAPAAKTTSAKPVAAKTGAKAPAPKAEKPAAAAAKKKVEKK
jgi:small subunit ribosomal protein S2